MKVYVTCSRKIDRGFWGFTVSFQIDNVNIQEYHYYMGKTIAEINQKIREGKAVVVTAEEIIDIAKKRG